MLEIEDEELVEDSPEKSTNLYDIIPDIPGANQGSRDEWGLLPRMRVFCDEWLACGNLTQAAIIAGYATKHADTHATDLMKRPSVRRYIAWQQARLRADRYDRQRRLLDELELLSHSDLDHYILDPDHGRIMVRDDAVDDRGRVVGKKATRALSKIKLKTKRYKDDEGNLVTEREADVATHSKTSAIDMYMKHLGMFPATGSRLEIEDAEGNTLVIEEVME